MNKLVLYRSLAGATMRQIDDLARSVLAPHVRVTSGTVIRFHADVIAISVTGFTKLYAFTLSIHLCFECAYS